MRVTLSAPEFVTIMGGPALMFPTAVFESQEAMITREAADLLNKVLRVAGFQAPFLGCEDLGRERDLCVFWRLSRR
jgi:hypothetical protein